MSQESKKTINEPKIIKLEEFIGFSNKAEGKEIKIPEYQRPYSWSEESVTTLYNDLLEAFKKKQREYRLGSIILYRDKDKHEVESLHIVDGQQRITTLALLLYSLDRKVAKDFPIFKSAFSYLSNNKILENFGILERRTKELNDSEGFKSYILKKCTVVQIITDHQQEAFQFFDGQNNRGKALAPHDLLKSYHLREMRGVNKEHTKEIVNEWENIDQQALVEFFSDYLYPLIKWYKKKSGLNYSVENIDDFKGISTKTKYNYAAYHRASHLFTEQYINNKYDELRGEQKANQFQLTEPILAGERFFHYVLHYFNLLNEVQKRIELYHVDKDGNFVASQIPSKRVGDKYVKELYENILLFLADRFGIDCLSDEILNFVYPLVYIVRLRMKAVYRETIDNYAIGDNSGRLSVYMPAIFEFMSCMNSPEELFNLKFKLFSLSDGKVIQFKELEPPQDQSEYKKPIYLKIMGKEPENTEDGK